MSTIKADTLSNLAGTQTVPVSTVAQGSAKAWVNFNGTGTVAIRASFNVSSITDNGVGNYTVNFTNALVDADFAVSGAFNVDSATRVAVLSSSSPTSGGVDIKTLRPNGDALSTYVGFDYSNISVAIFR
jgi:hypothetical protein